MKKIKCCVCGREIDERDSNDPFPYETEGRCCDDCNLEYVIPARMADIHKTPACAENPRDRRV